MLELQLSSFFGYGKSDDDSYLGLQAHGVLWAANPSDTPVNWPIAPPIVAGKVSLTLAPHISCKACLLETAQTMIIINLELICAHGMRCGFACAECQVMPLFSASLLVGVGPLECHRGDW